MQSNFSSFLYIKNLVLSDPSYNILIVPVVTPTGSTTLIIGSLTHRSKLPWNKYLTIKIIYRILIFLNLEYKAILWSNQFIIWTNMEKKSSAGSNVSTKFVKTAVTTNVIYLLGIHMNTWIMLYKLVSPPTFLPSCWK